MLDWAAAGAAGLFAGGALLLGSAIAWLLRVPTRVVAIIMAVGSGVLISALAFELVQEANATGGLIAPAAGFMVGSVVYVALNIALARSGARHRKRSGTQQPSEEEHPSSGDAIALGALPDGIPESMLSSTAGWENSGRGAGYVLGFGARSQSPRASPPGRLHPGERRRPVHPGLRQRPGSRGHPRRDHRHHDPRGFRDGRP